MKFTDSAFIFRLVVSFLLLAIAFSVVFVLIMIKPTAQRKETTDTTPLVLTSKVALYKGMIEMENSGVVVPFRNVTMSAEVAGKISVKSDDCKAGNFVKAGTPLIEIDREEYELEVARAAAELKQAELQAEELSNEIVGATELLSVAKDDEQIQQAELDRLESLGEVVSTSEVNQARRALLSSQNAVLNQTTQLNLLTKRVDRLASGIDLSEARLKTAKLNRDRATVVAPSDGVIVTENVQKGDFVQRGSPLFEFEDVSAAEVKINLRPSELQQILNSQPANPTSADPTTKSDKANPYRIPNVDVQVIYELDGQRSQWSGKLSRYDGAGLDERTRTIPCRILVSDRMSKQSDGQPRLLVRNMYVRVKLMLPSQIRLFQVPDVAVQPGNVVWSVDSDGQIHRHRLNVVSIYQDEKSARIDDKSGWVIFPDSDNAPQPGTSVVVTPLINPVEGMEVRSEPATMIPTPVENPHEHLKMAGTNATDTNATDTNATDKENLLSAHSDDTPPQNRDDDNSNDDNSNDDETRDGEKHGEDSVGVDDKSKNVESNNNESVSGKASETDSGRSDSGEPNDTSEIDTSVIESKSAADSDRESETENAESTSESTAQIPASVE